MCRAKILELMTQVTGDINNRIVKCNDARDRQQNKLYQPLVLIVQKKCDEILGNPSVSFLERILLCTEVINKYNAGNCMLQSFVAFDELIKSLISSGLMTMNTALPISICTTKDHTFVLVEDLVCDSWGKYVGSWKEYSFAKEQVSYYFRIDADWKCYDNKRYDQASTNYTYTLMQQYAPEEASASSENTATLIPGNNSY